MGRSGIKTPPVRLAREAAIRARQGARPPIPSFSLPAADPDPIYVERAARIARKAREGKPSEAVSTILDYQSRLEHAPLLRMIADALGGSLLVDDEGEVTSGYARRLLLATGAERATTPLTVRLFKRADQIVPYVHLRESADAAVTLCGEELDFARPNRHVLWAPRGTFTRRDDQFDCPACLEAGVAVNHPDACEQLRFDPLTEHELEIISEHAGNGVRAAVKASQFSLDAITHFAREQAPAGFEQVVIERLSKLEAAARIERWFGHFPSCEEHLCREYHEFGFVRSALSERYGGSSLALPQPDTQALLRALEQVPRLVEPTQLRYAGEAFRAELIAQVWPDVVSRLSASATHVVPRHMRERWTARGLVRT